MVDLGADPHRRREGIRAHGDDHELLEVDRVVGVRPAVEHIHHRHRQQRSALAGQAAPERDARVGGLRVCDRERCAENRVRAEAPLVRRPVELDERAVKALLIGGVATAERRGDLALDVSDRLRHPLAPVRRATVAQLDRLVRAGRGARGHRGATEGAGLQQCVDLDGGVAAAVEDGARVQLGDCAHAACTLAAGAGAGRRQRPGASRYRGQIFSAAATSVSSLRHCTSSVTSLPT